MTNNFAVLHEARVNLENRQDLYYLIICIDNIFKSNNIIIF